MPSLSLTLAFIKNEKTGTVTAFVHEIPGVVTEGKNIDDAKKSLIEALIAIQATNAHFSSSNSIASTKGYELSTQSLPLQLA